MVNTSQRWIPTIFILFAILFMFTMPPAGQASTFTVNSTSDHTPDGCDPLPDDCTLREAIDAANSTAGPDLITFSIDAGTDPGWA